WGRSGGCDEHGRNRITSTNVQVKMAPEQMLTVSEVAARAGVSPSALRFYERQGLIESERTTGNQRRYHRDVLRRLAFIHVAQRVGLSLEKISEALNSLPAQRTPNQRDWERLSSRWHAELDERVRLLSSTATTAPAASVVALAICSATPSTS